MKKLWALMLSLALCLSLAACGVGSGASTDTNADGGTDEASDAQNETVDEESGPVKMTLILRAGTYANVIKACLPAFEADNNVTCEVLELSEDDLHSGIALDAINAVGTYDLCMVDGSWMAEFTENGVLADLSALGYELDDDIIPATTDICVVDGSTYLAPYYGNVTVLLYNKGLVAAVTGSANGGMDTLQDILTTCQRAAERGSKGFLYRGDSHNNTVVDFLPILLSFGGWVVDENNQPTVDTEEFHRAVDYYLQLISTGEAQVKDDLIASVDSGAATMGIGWPGWYTPTDETTADYTAITGVAEPGAEAYNANVYGIWTIGVPANAPHPDLGEELLAYLMDPDVQKSTIPSGGVPCRYSSLQDPEVLEAYPQYEVVCRALEGGKYRPVLAQWPQMYDILGAELDNILNNVKTTDQGLADAQSQLESLLAG